MEAFLKRDRLVIIIALAVITVISWYYIVFLSSEMKTPNMAAMPGMSGMSNMPAMSNMSDSYHTMAMPTTEHWSAYEFLMMFVMWSVMMVAMMLPSAAPLLLLFASINRKRQQQNNPYVSTSYFLAGYLLVWAGFSIAATGLQWLFQYFRLLSPMMVTTNAVAGSIILFGAGIFQFTPLKNKCLTRCRTPIDFVTRHWKEGSVGALRMGLEHGSFCLGCCWILMCVLFVTGIMNVLWIALISFFVLLEKVVPKGLIVSRIAGIVLIVNAVWLLI